MRVRFRLLSASSELAIDSRSRQRFTTPNDHKPDLRVFLDGFLAAILINRSFTVRGDSSAGSNPILAARIAATPSGLSNWLPC